MGKLGTVGVIEFWVLGRDHRPAHFHVIHPDYEAMIDIVTLSVIRGAIPARDRRVVMAWVDANRDRLIAAWNRWNPDLAI